MRFPPILLVLLLALPARGTITLQFSDFANALTGLSDTSGGTGVNGLTWGILIDTEGDGIPQDGGFPALVGSLGLNLVDGVDLGNNDLFFFGGTTTTVGGLDGGAGGVTTANDLDPYSAAGVTTNDPFYVMWFGNTGIVENSELAPGTPYGIIDDTPLTLPADGTGTTSFASTFAGADAVRTADLTLVPEPSSLVLLLLAGFPILRRRR